MQAPRPWSRMLVIVGGIAMLFGAVDPLEGSLVILAGSVLVLVGTSFAPDERKLPRYWLATVGLIAVGVGAMFALSARGGIGGDSGQSLWWGVLILPYPIGWALGIINLLIRLVRNVRHRRATDERGENLAHSRD